MIPWVTSKEEKPKSMIKSSVVYPSTGILPKNRATRVHKPRTKDNKIPPEPIKVISKIGRSENENMESKNNRNFFLIIQALFPFCRF